MFHVGQRVVCVDTNPHGLGPHEKGKPELRVGCIYTIDAIVKPPKASSSYHCGLKHGVAVLREVDWPNGFCLHRFRPLDERATDITIFQEIARKVQHNEPVVV